MQSCGVCLRSLRLGTIFPVSTLPGWLALQPRASTSMAARHVEAAAALLNSGDSEADFLEAKKLFQAALQVEPELRAAQ